MKFNYNPVEPVRITSRFGKRNTGIKGASTDHKGIDLGKNRAVLRTPLVLTNEATLIENGWNDYRGWYCIFKIDDTFNILYQHMKDKCSLTLNKKYPPGTVIGFMGNSSNKNKLKCSTHLHFEVRKNGVPINPEKYLNDLEEYEMIENIKMIVNGKEVAISRILKNGENYIRLRDIDSVLGLAKIGYDNAKKMPVVTEK